MKLTSKQEPEIEIELVSSDQTDNLLEREADIAVRNTTGTAGCHSQAIG
jgi:DNA-binding transcriptional LysR family regulator